jgi:two-component system, sporulation sensor kinase A
MEAQKTFRRIAMVTYQITEEYLQNNDKLPVSQELLKLISDYAQEFIIIISPDGHVEYISPVVRNVLGYDPDEIVGTLSYSALHSEDFNHLSTSNLLHEADEETFECRVKHKNGQYIWLEATIKAIQDDEGKIQHFIGIGRDISERKQAEDKIRKNNEQLKSFIENNADAIWVIDVNDTVLEVNPSFEKMFGWMAGEAIGKKLPIIPEYLNESMDHIHQRIKSGETIVGLETIRQHKDGHFLRVEATLSPIRNLNGVITGITGICRDVTLRKRAEKELKAKTSLLESFIENNVDAIVIYDQEGLVQRVNKTFEKVFGWSKEEILGMELENVPYIPDVYKYEAQQSYERVKNGLSIIGLETIRKNKNGDDLNVSLTISPIPNEQGEMDGWSISLRDITELKKAQQHLQNSEKLSVAGQLAAGIAHEIRNPMTAIKGFMQLINSEYKLRNEFFEIIESEIDRIELILSELLILAKPQAIKYDRKDVRVILNQVLTLLDTQAILNNIQFVEEFMPGETQVYCDGNQLKQVFINFIKNSMEAMPNGGKIAIEVHNSNDEEVVIRLIDQGCGISKEVLSRLGEPFYTTKEKGTGLGFMVSKKIIENHSGKITVQSQPNKGTEIEIRLPVE